MTDDIVARLRQWSDNAKEQNATEVVVGLSEAADEIERVRMDRDSLRRRVCREAFHRGPIFRRVGRETVQCQTPEEVAESLGWDCFGGGAA